MGNKLFVGNLSWNIDDAQLNDFFSSVGTVAEAVVIKDRIKNRSKGYGFVKMSTEEEAQKAIDELNGKELDGRPVNVSEAREESHEGRSFGGERRSFGGERRSFGERRGFDRR